MDDVLMTRSELLKALRVGKDFLYTDEGKSLPLIRIGKKMMIRREALRAWLLAREAGAPTPAPRRNGGRGRRGAGGAA